MTTEMVGLTEKLRELGVDPSILKMVKKDLRKVHAPMLGEAVIDRLREEVSLHRKALLVMGRNGHYSVFSPEGHAALRASAKRNKPWEGRRKTAAGKKAVKH